MATIIQHIANLRTLLKIQSDDSRYKDRFLIQLLSQARATLLRQRSNKNEVLNSANWIGFCMLLEPVRYLDCGCANRPDCLVLRSKYELPTVLNGYNGELINVRYNDENLASFAPYQVKSNQHHRALKDRVGYWIESTREYGRRLVVWNTLKLKSIPVFALWENFEALVDIQSCCETCEPVDDCDFDWRTVEFPIDGDLVSVMYQLIEERLISKIQLKDDELNNTADENF